MFGLNKASVIGEHTSDPPNQLLNISNTTTYNANIPMFPLQLQSQLQFCGRHYNDDPRSSEYHNNTLSYNNIPTLSSALLWSDALHIAVM
jgi:hypothetical protein